MNDWFPLCLPTAVVEYLQTTGCVQHIVLLTTHNRQKMTEKHRSVNNVLWRVVAGRMRPAGRQLDTPDLDHYAVVAKMAIRRANNV